MRPDVDMLSTQFNQHLSHIHKLHIILESVLRFVALTQLKPLEPRGLSLSRLASKRLNLKIGAITTLDGVRVLKEKRPLFEHPLALEVGTAVEDSESDPAAEVLFLANAPAEQTTALDEEFEVEELGFLVIRSWASVIDPELTSRVNWNINHGDSRRS